MVQELLRLLPTEVATPVLTALLLAAAGGLGLWLAGSRVSPMLVIAATVIVGAMIGSRTPRWFGWPIEAWAPAVGGAIALGATGYAMHRQWVAVGFGLVLATWAGAATWILASHGNPLALPTVPVDDWATLSRMQLLHFYWDNLPGDVAQLLPFACGAALVLGTTAALLWPRAGLVLLYSSLGVTLLVGSGLAAAYAARPSWVARLPAQTSSQVLLLLALVAFGALLQWRPGAAEGAPAPGGAALSGRGRRPERPVKTGSKYSPGDDSEPMLDGED